MFSLLRYPALLLFFSLIATAPLFGEEPQRQTVDSHGVKINYVAAGQGEAVILLHGYLSSALVNWQLPGIFAKVGKDYRVVALDFPGHGASDKPENADAYGVAMVEDVIKVMDAQGIQKAHIVGYSMGGMVACKFATLHPERSLSVALCGMGWLRDEGFLQKFYAGAGRENTPHALCFREFSKLAVSEEALKAIKVPVEMLVGENDICKVLYVEPAHRVRPDWPVVYIQDADHFSCIVKPQFKDEVKKWVDGQAKK